MSTVAFIGLGTMGLPMAGHLERAGHQVRACNRGAAGADRWRQEHRGIVAASPAEAALGAEVVFACVGADADVREVTIGPQGAFAAMAPGTVFVDHTTASAGLARELYVQAAARGLAFVDAPVSGGQAGARGGTLTVMCGGDPGAFEKVRTFIACYARACELIGGAGAGQLAKMVNQICIAGLLQALAEGLDFGQRAGLDMQRVIEVIGKGAAQSWQMDNRAATMCRDEFDFGFAVQWMRKDLAMCLEEARRNGARLPVTALVDQFYAEIQDGGGARLDTSSLIRRLRRH
ncbi:MAG: NAD(P)-dependent oxidoreductase [Gammaproteobacteria bacterium]